MSDSLWPGGLQHVRLLCPLWCPAVCSSSCPLNQWCYLILFHPLLLLPSIFPSVKIFSMSWLLASGGQSTGASASVLPVNIQDWFPLGWTGLTSLQTGLISLQSKGISSVFSSTTVQKHIFFCSQKNYGPTLTSVHNYWKHHSFDYRDICWQTDLFVL